MEAGPTLAFSRPPCVTLGDLRKIGHRRLGGGFHRRLQPPKNLAVQGFLAEKPRETGKQEENILCLQLSPAKCAGSGAVTRMWVPGNQVPFRLGSVKDVMSLPGVHFLEAPPQTTPPHTALWAACLLTPFSTRTRILHSYSSPAVSRAAGEGLHAALRRRPGFQTPPLILTCSPSWGSPGVCPGPCVSPAAQWE